MYYSTKEDKGIKRNRCICLLTKQVLRKKVEVFDFAKKTKDLYALITNGKASSPKKRSFLRKKRDVALLCKLISGNVVPRNEKKSEE